jgi:VCBS repeat protein/PASTA domain-containing protein
MNRLEPPAAIFPVGAGIVVAALVALGLSGTTNAQAGASVPSFRKSSATGSTHFARATDYATGNGPVSVADHDLNGDGSPDIVAANLYAQTLSVLVNRGDGTFQRRRDYRAGGDLRSVAIGDLNVDGNPDLVNVNHTEPSAVSVLLNRGNATFRPRRNYGVPGFPVEVALGDLNGDGRPDVVTADRMSTVSVLFGRGDGRLRGARDYQTGLEPVSLGLGDLNSDATQDLVTANVEANAVSVLLNTGKGGFQPRRDHAVGRGPIAVAIGDLSADGKADIITANLDANTVTVLLNEGDGRFESRADYRAGGDPRSVALGDVDRDGKPDIVTVNAEASTASVLLNAGDGSFKPRLDFATGLHPVSLAIDDLNGDRMPDVATANLRGNTVSILLAGTTVFCTAPEVIGETLTGATQAIEAAHCRVGTVRHAYSNSVEKGNVSLQRPRAGTTLPASSLVDLVVSDGPRPGSGARGLLLWNRLGSPLQVRHSVYGPTLGYFGCRDRTMPSFHEHCSIDVRGKLRYLHGVLGGAATIGGGAYFPGARVHTALLRNSILSPEHGAVEVWYRQRSNPVPFKHNPHRVFGGPYSLTGADEVMLFSQDRRDSGDPRLHFEVFFGEEPPPFRLAHVVAVRSLVDGGRGYRISRLNGRWIRVAGVWDREGIAGTKDTVRLYVNGKVVAAAKATNWGTTPCGRRVSARPGGACFTDVAGCNDTCAGAFAVDELKLWNYAKTR